MSSSDRRHPLAIGTPLLVIALGALAAVGCGGWPPSRAGETVAVAAADNASRPGEPVAEPSTFHSLGIRWPVRGDANADAVIDVRYRRRGATAWQKALPLFRTNPEAVSAENRVPDGWLFAGSIVDLAPDTEYEVALALTDPARLDDADGGGAP